MLRTFNDLVIAEFQSLMRSQAFIIVNLTALKDRDFVRIICFAFTTCTCTTCYLKVVTLMQPIFNGHSYQNDLLQFLFLFTKRHDNGQNLLSVIVFLSQYTFLQLIDFRALQCFSFHLLFCQTIFQPKIQLCLPCKIHFML